MPDENCQQQAQDQLQQKHWSIRWVYGKWPVAIKVASIVVGIAGGIGTIMGLGSSLVKAVQSHDENIRTQTVIAEQLKQRNDKIDKTLNYHGQQLWAVEKKVGDLDNKVDAQSTKLDRIERATEKPKP